MVEVAGRLVLAAVLLGASASKLASPGTSRAALATFGIQGLGLQSATWVGLIAIEVALAVGVLVGIDVAAWLAAALMAGFAAAMLVALARGRGGAPCACFGSRSRVSWPAIGRNLVLAGAFAALPLLPAGTPTTDQWLALGLIVALIACVGLAVAVLALAREVGMLRLRFGPESALEIPDEGPQVGSSVAMIERFELTPTTELALAVFVSDGCRACRALEPAIESLANEPVLAVGTFEAVAEPQIWTELAIPGSPYAIAIGLDGTVLAKGTFNNLAQLESILATAERRRASREVGVGVV